MGCVLYEMAALVPPFRADDMQGLYKKVLKGQYPKIPSHYSQDLSKIIRVLLQVHAHLRPTTDQLLKMPTMMDKFELLEDESPSEQSILLKTIRYPKDLYYLTDRLPRANYLEGK